MKNIFVSVISVAILLGFLIPTISCSSTPAYFTIAVLPDAQIYSRSYPAIFDNQTQWMVGNAKAQNIVFVAQLGDLINNYDVTSQWTNAVHSMSIIRNAGIPYSVVPGNHDLNRSVGNLSYFDSYFPYTDFTGYSWYGGHYDSTNTSNYELISVQGQKFIILNIVCSPDLYANAKTWANKTLTTYSDRKAIVISHDYISYDGSYVGAGSEVEGGLAVWNDIVRYHTNVVMVLCGHMYNGCSNSMYHNTATGVNGNTVYQILTDFQDCPNGGNGWLRLYKFYPSLHKISAITYSPYLNQYDTGAQGQFDLSYD
jgi:hypothetical protein